MCRPHHQGTCRRLCAIGSSLFALLELLSLIWSSCLEAETDLYEPRSCFTSVRAKVTVELSDDYDLRKFTLVTLYRKAKAWVTGVLSLAPADVKGLLQTYLSEWDDQGAYGHISLGRSFAFELGSYIPSTDQRLTSLEKLGDCKPQHGVGLHRPVHHAPGVPLRPSRCRTIAWNG